MPVNPQNNDAGKYLVVGGLGLAGAFIIKTLMSGGFGGGGAKKVLIRAITPPTFNVVLIDPMIVSVTEPPTFDIVMV